MESGERYMVQWRSGQWHYGDIIALRSLKQKVNGGSGSSTANEYYVHYPGR